jgi:hypothetical protein
MYYYLMVRRASAVDMKAAVELLEEVYGAKLCGSSFLRIDGTIYRTSTCVDDEVCNMLGLIKYR